MNFPVEFFFFPSSEGNQGLGHREKSEQKLKRGLFKELTLEKLQLYCALQHLETGWPFGVAALPPSSMVCRCP